jgi:hypothetical protein
MIVPNIIKLQICISKVAKAMNQGMPARTSTPSSLSLQSVVGTQNCDTTPR